LRSELAHGVGQVGRHLVVVIDHELQAAASWCVNTEPSARAVPRMAYLLRT
jgi:hypothetical protein